MESREGAGAGIFGGMQGLVFFDDGRGHFGPMTDLRSAVDLRSGILTSAERLSREVGLPVIGMIVPGSLEGVVAAAHPDLAVNIMPEGEGPFLVLNARLLELPTGDLPALGTAMVDSDDQSIGSALLDRSSLQSLIEHRELPDGVSRSSKVDLPLARAAWDVFATAGSRIASDLDLLAAEIGASSDPRTQGAMVLGDHPVQVDDTVGIDPGVVLDAREGAIFIGPGVHLGIHAAIHGPCAVLDGTRIADHATIKANTVIGPHCRIGGEVGGTVFQGFANKSHDGHLGDSWVGSWANLGAATVNSNLLNTYGEVTMKLTPGGPRIRSGRQFLGCIVGDHAKTAIGTRIMTGTAIGTGAMVATSTPPPATTPAFAWLTDDGTRSYRFEKFIEVARAVMARRKIVLEVGVEDRLRVLHAEATAEGGS